jgi:hypothetical protein
MINKKLIFDLDGTLVDLYGVDNWLEMLRSEDATPYEIAKPLVDMENLVKLLCELQSLGWIIAVTSWLAMDSTPEYKKSVRSAKREWLTKYNFPIDEIHLVQYGTPKQKCSKADIQILFDDSATVRESFSDKEKGRYTVNPNETNILEVLNFLKKLN